MIHHSALPLIKMDNKRNNKGKEYMLSQWHSDVLYQGPEKHSHQDLPWTRKLTLPWTQGTIMALPLSTSQA